MLQIKIVQELFFGHFSQMINNVNGKRLQLVKFDVILLWALLNNAMVNEKKIPQFHSLLSFKKFMCGCFHTNFKIDESLEVHLS